MDTCEITNEMVAPIIIIIGGEKTKHDIKQQSDRLYNSDNPLYSLHKDRPEVLKAIKIDLQITPEMRTPHYCSLNQHIFSYHIANILY